MTLKVAEGHREWRDSIGHNHFILVVCSNSSVSCTVSDILPLYSVRDLEQFFSFDTTVEITGQIMFSDSYVKIS